MISLVLASYSKESHKISTNTMLEYNTFYVSAIEHLTALAVELHLVKCLYDINDVDKCI